MVDVGVDVDFLTGLCMYRVGWGKKEGIIL